MERSFYGEILVPEAVFGEVVRAAPEAPGAAEAQEAGWLLVRPAQDRILIDALELELDRGEAEAIALAAAREADLLLMDERRGRSVARRLGFRAAGVLAVLVEAKRKGLLAEIRPVLDALRIRAGFRVSDELYRRVLREVSE